jgi:hypothetical protein
VCDNVLYHTLNEREGTGKKAADIHRMTTEIILAPSPHPQPAFFAHTPKAAKRVLEFFTTQISNDHTRRAYMNAARRFADRCADNSIHELSKVQPFHVAAFIKELQDELSPPTVSSTWPRSGCCSIGLLPGMSSTSILPMPCAVPNMSLKKARHLY